MIQQEQSQWAEELRLIETIVDVEVRTCQMLGVDPGECLDVTDGTDKINQITRMKYLQYIRTLSKKIFNSMLKNTTSHLSNVPQTQQPSSQNNFQPHEENQDYCKIQDLLQKQQSKNRTLLRKQFQFKEYQNSVIDELNQLKEQNQKLREELGAKQKELEEKRLEVTHLGNLLRARDRDYGGSLTQRENGRLDRMESRQMSNHKKNGAVVTLEHHQLFGKPIKLLYGQSTSKALSKSTTKKLKQTIQKQKSLYALYNSKKQHQTINLHTINHSSSGIKKSRQKKAVNQNNMNSMEVGSRRGMHDRRKSEGYFRQEAKERRQSRGRRDGDRDQKREKVKISVHF